MPLDNAERYQAPELLDSLAKVISIGSPAVAIGALACDWAYWQQIDPAIFDMMSLSEHIGSALGQLPGLLFAGSLCVLIAGFVRSALLRRLGSWLINCYNEVNPVSTNAADQIDVHSESDEARTGADEKDHASHASKALGHRAPVGWRWVYTVAFL